MTDPELILEAPAKLNLFLEITGRRADGYHEIDSLFAEIDLCDTILLRRASRVSLEVEGESAPEGPDNLAWRAADALGVGAHIRLRKRIPAGAGLGGGSSDAAAVLRGLDRLYGLGLGARRLAELALGLGADVPYFLVGGAARCRGIGERVDPLPPAAGRSFHLLVPNLHIRTAEVYRELDTGLTGKSERARFFPRKFLGEGPGRLPCFNRLQGPAERLEPRLRAIREEAEARFGAPFHLTGSGSAYFAEIAGDGGPPASFEASVGVRVRSYRVRTR